MRSVLVISGGPDAEHDVSVASGRTIASALRDSGRYDVHEQVIDDLSPEALAAMPGDAVFSALHGPFGEGGALQRLLDEDGRPYVGSGGRASRIAIDKVLTKTIAARTGLVIASGAILDPGDTGLALDLPVVVKPIFEGSTIGLYVCRTIDQWLNAHRASVASGRPTMVEPMVPGRELTVGAVDRGRGLEALPIIEITPADGLYDYEAKYARNDTLYRLRPELPPGVGERIQRKTLELARTIGIRDLCRADFILDDQGNAFFLEINTMPGFTDHSLVPMAARAAGFELPDLCAGIVDHAIERAGHVTPQEEQRA